MPAVAGATLVLRPPDRRATLDNMDGRLRALERAARSNPGDREAAWSFVRALDQRGDARAAWVERCRLARAGDDLAWRELSPAPRGARRLTAGAMRTFDMSTVGGARTDGRSTLLLVGDSTVHALDARSLERTWSAATLGADPGAVWGPWVVHVGSEPATLPVRDLRTGQQVDRLELPPGVFGRAVAAFADRVAVCCCVDGAVPDALVVIEPARTGASRADPVLRSGVTPHVVRDVSLHVNHPTRGSTSARDLATGDVRWTALGTPLQADALAAFLLTSAGRSMQIACVDVTTGRTAWTHLVAADHTAFHAIGPDLFVIATTPPAWSKTGRERLDIDAVERGTGEVRWSFEEVVGVHGVAAIAVARDVVYVVHGPVVDDGPAPVSQARTLLALDARTGERVDSAAIPPTVSGRFTLFPVDGAVLVVARGRHTTWVGRFGDD